MSTISPVPKVEGRWRSLSSFGIALVMDGVEGGVVTTLFPMIRSALGLSLSSLGLLTGIGRFIGVIFGPFWVWVARRWSRKGVLVLFTGFWGVWAFAAGLSQNFTQLVIFTTIMAAGNAGGTPLIMEIISDLFDDGARGRAIGVLYGLNALGVGVITPALAVLSEVENGWRIGFFIAGGVSVLSGVLIQLFFTDPGLGATEPLMSALTAEQRNEDAKLTWAKAAGILRVPTFLIIMGYRVLCGHLVVLAFLVVFLVDVYGFSTLKASSVVPVYALGYFAGTILGGLLTDSMHRRWPRTGRIGLFQGSVFTIALVGYFATQLDWSLPVIMMFFALLAVFQGMQGPINRPIVMSVMLPELRGAAFAIWLSIFEALVAGVYLLAFGYFGDAYGLRVVFLWMVVITTVLNGIFLTLLYRPYLRDSQKVQDVLAARAKR
ncbi:MFS transporter [Nonomuraea endophytica]|uniref:MFS transporter n=1 Tax=Nonomuraea endophytica TaxID=714136 RepID=UPI0037C65BD9